MNNTEDVYRYKGYIHQLFNSQMDFGCSDVYDLGINIIGIMEANKKLEKAIDEISFDLENAEVSFHFSENYDEKIANEAISRLIDIIKDCIDYTRNIINIDYGYDYMNYLIWVSNNPFNVYTIGNTMYCRL